MKKILFYSILIIFCNACEPKTEEIPTGNITTSDVSGITATTAVCGGTINATSNVTILQKGVIWSVSPEKIENGNENENEKNNTPHHDGSELFLCRMTGLKPDTKYYVRAFVQIGMTEKRFVYGAIKEFTTAVANPADSVPGTNIAVKTLPVSGVTATGAILNGNITNAGNPVYSERGFCYSSSSKSPTVDDTKIIVANPVAFFVGDYSAEINIAGFTHNTHYYIRAYLINSGKVTYGETVELSAITPVINTRNAYNITANSVTLEAALSNKGIPLCSEWGFYYSTSPDFFTKESVKAVLTSNTYSLKGLSPNTTYYYCAYAMNSFITVCSDTMNFTTLKSEPVVNTLAASNMTPTSATIGGKTTFTGAPAYTERGICCSRHNCPTIDNFDYKEIILGINTDIFTKDLTNLTDGVTYVARAYAVWEGKVIYGECVSFTPYSYKTVGNLAVQKKDVYGLTEWENGEYECRHSNLGGKKWRLPTLSELQILYENQTIIGGFNNTGSTVIFRSYWSSTASNRDYYLMDFSDGKSYAGHPYSYAGVRCVSSISE